MPGRESDDVEDTGWVDATTLRPVVEPPTRRGWLGRVVDWGTRQPLVVTAGVFLAIGLVLALTYVHLCP